MAKVELQPFSFSEEDFNDSPIELDTNELPGAKPIKEENEEETSNVSLNEEDKLEDPISELASFLSENAEENLENSESITSEKVDYKSLTNFLIESEIWKDFEGREDMEFNEEVFQSLAKEQANAKAQEELEAERQNFGPSANELIEYLKAGGTLEEFLNNFSQQTDIEAISIEDLSGQEKIIKTYYKSLSWSDTKISKHLDRLRDSGEDDFKEEAEDCKSKLIEAIQEERQEEIRQKDQIKKDKAAKLEAFNNEIKKAIQEDANLDKKSKKELEDFYYKYKFQDNNGNKYSEFSVKMNEVTSDPKKYQKFLKFIKNIDSFEEKATTETKANKQIYNFLKTGSNPLEGANSQEVIKEAKKPTTLAPFKFK